MSLQEISFYYMIFMLVAPITCLMTFKKIQEVKPLTELLDKEVDISCVVCHSVQVKGPKPFWTTEFFVCFSCFKERKGPFMLGAVSYVAHPTTGEAVNLYQYKYECNLVNEASLVVDTLDIGSTV